MIAQAHPQQTRRPTLERPPLRPVETKRRQATLHLFTYAAGNALAWLLWGAVTISTDHWYWWPLVPLAGWTLVLALHLRHVSRTEVSAGMHRPDRTNSVAAQLARAAHTPTANIAAAISVSGLVKDFGSTRALDRLDLTVRTGEVHGFLGPNGAGKTTTVRILLGLLRRDAGEVAVLGEDPWRDVVTLHRRLAYVPGEVNLWPNLTGGEVIDLLGALRGGLDRERRSALLERLQLDPTKKCRAYSKGNRQKVALVAAFASDVELYLLDEPTSGLDPLMEVVFQDVVREMRNAGRTVLLSSHILAEVEALCDRVTIIRAGRAAETGTFDELRHLTRTTVVVETAEPIGTLSDLPGVHDVSADDTRAQFSVDAGELNHVLERLVELDVRSLTSSPPTLEELFMRHYGKDVATADEAALVEAR